MMALNLEPIICNHHIYIPTRPKIFDDCVLVVNFMIFIHKSLKMMNGKNVIKELKQINRTSGDECVTVSKSILNFDKCQHKFAFTTLMNYLYSHKCLMYAKQINLVFLPRRRLLRKNFF